MAPITHPDRYNDSIEFWRNVYGIDMSAMLQLAKQCAFEEPCMETITGENVLTWPHVVKHVDCYTIQHDELESVSTRYKFQSMMRAPLHGFAFWFDVEFSGPENSPTNDHIPSLLIGTSNSNHMDGIQKKKRANPNEALVLSTAPEDPPTHWQQTLIYFYDPIDVEQDQIIEGSLTLSQSKENRRFMNIHLEYSIGRYQHRNRRRKCLFGRHGGVRNGREDGDNKRGSFVGAVVDYTLCRLRGYDGTYGGGDVDDGEH
ncbi:hypothetical protein V6N11_083052 [Hibiscus sabdariffa]|uniref:Protein arginine N-methyltransferase domain-containing protein n=1 Tax=Hibiscus sabdariffa TaxID=183260 RepID=A0ABR2QKV7_9ROSI